MRSLLPIVLWPVLVVSGACNDKDTTGTQEDSTTTSQNTFGKTSSKTPTGTTKSRGETGDFDGDGYSVSDGDCDDTDPSAYPRAPEWLLGHDLNCDGEMGGSLSQADYSFIGEFQGWEAASVSTAGDVDGDGRDDVLIGSCGASHGGPYAGKGYIILGSSLGPQAMSLTDADYHFVGENEYDYAGCTVSSAGDVDGDGLGDIIIGATGSDMTVSAPDTGRAYIILGRSLGPSTTMSLTDADYNIVGEGIKDGAGGNQSSAGDIDGDGLGDIIIGVGGSDDGGEGAGEAYIVLGGSLGSSQEMNLKDADYTFVGENDYDLAGCEVAGAGDVDGDGFVDVIIGAYGNDDGGDAAGKSYVVLGSALGSPQAMILADADYSFVGENEHDYASRALSSAGDADGDGLGDIIIGAEGNDDNGEDSGKAYIILGSSLGAASTMSLADADYSFVGENTGEDAGWSLSTAGDVDGDGLGDVIIGAGRYHNNGVGSGTAYVVLGRSLDTAQASNLADADYRFVGEDVGDSASSEVSTAGDVNGDGLDEILIGASGNDDGGQSAGKAYLVLSHL